MNPPPLPPHLRPVSSEPASSTAPEPSPTQAPALSIARPESPLATQLPEWDLLPPSAFIRRNVTR